MKTEPWSIFGRRNIGDEMENVVVDLSIPKSSGGPRVQLSTGNWMPLVGLGTYKIVGHEAMERAVDAALGCGYRHFDTAKLYKNEPELGDSLEKFLPKHGLKREDIFITTKFFPMHADEAAEQVPALMAESLANLKTSYLDLVLVHYPKPEANANEDAAGNAASRRECWRALEKIPAEMVHSIGVSNYEVKHLEEMGGYAKMRGPAVNQVEYHPHFRRPDIREYCRRHGIFFQAFSSLARQEPKLLADPVVVELANNHKTTPQNIILSFATSQGVGIVPKSANPERIVANLDCVDLQLAEEELHRLNSIPVDQPYIRCVPWLIH